MGQSSDRTHTIYLSSMKPSGEIRTISYRERRWEMECRSGLDQAERGLSCCDRTGQFSRQ